MMKFTGLVFVTLLLSVNCNAGEPVPPTPAVPPMEFHVLRYTWEYCWRICGGGDKNPAAVSTYECICAIGEPRLINPKYPKPQPKPIPPPPPTVEESIIDEMLEMLEMEK